MLNLSLSNRLKGLSKKHKLSFFLSGLKDEIRLPITMLNPINLSVAFGLIKIQEEYVWNSRKALRAMVGSSDRQQFGVVEDVGRRFHKIVGLERKISSLHMDEKRNKGLFYHYEEKWNPSHVCKNSRVYLLQMEDSEVRNESGQDSGVDEAVLVEHDVETKQESLHISIHAVSGSPSANTMRVFGVIGVQLVVILVDSRSTHKYRLGVTEIYYLGHQISRDEEKADLAKISSMLEYWPILVSLKSLRGFLGLTEYYMKFIRGCGPIATALLKKNSF